MAISVERAVELMDVHFVEEPLWVDIWPVVKSAALQNQQSGGERTTNSQSDAIALVCEIGRAMDKGVDLFLWANRNQARIRTVCIAQQHT